MSLGNLGTATVNVVANTAGYNAAIAALPAKFADAESKIRAQMARNQLAIKQMLASGAGGTGYTQIIQQQDQLAKKLQAVQMAAGKAAGAIASVSAAGSRAGGGGAGGRGGTQGGKQSNGAYRLQQIGQTLDDLQYVGEMGIRPILNNLMQISPILGIVGIAIDQVARHWSFFTRGAELAKTPIEELQAKIKLLEPKSKYSLIDLKNLDDAKKKLEELEENEEIVKRLRTTKSEAATDLGAGLEKAVADSGALDKIIEGMIPGAIADRVKDGSLKTGMFGAGGAADDAKLTAAIAAAKQGFIDDFAKAAKGDEAARRRLAFAGAGGSGAAGDFATALKDKDNADLHAAILDAQSLLNEIKGADAAAVEDSDALNLEQFKEAKAKRRKQAEELRGAPLTLDLLKHNASASEEGRATVEAGLKGKLTAAGIDKGKVEALAREMVDLTLREIDKEVKDKVASGQAGGAVAARSSLRRETEGQVRDERRAQLQKEFGKAEVLSTDSYLSKIMAAGQSAMNDPARAAVEEQKKTNKTLEKIAKNTEMKDRDRIRASWVKGG